MQYSFRDLQPTNKNEYEDIPTEGFVFGSFDSRKAGWWVVSREAPTPTENEIVEQVAYTQGVYDFSMFNGERFFGNREITYKIVMPLSVYHERKTFEEEIKRQLMPVGIGNLVDTHEDCYYWSGKCKSVEVDDDEEKGMLTATVVFDCYPYAYTNNLEGADIWDDVIFDHWIWQPVKFNVTESMDVTLENIGSRPVICHFAVTGKVTVKGPGFNGYELTKDNADKATITMPLGKNKFTLSGSGTIEFKFRREEMI